MLWPIVELNRTTLSPCIFAFKVVFVSKNKCSEDENVSKLAKKLDS